MKIRLIGAIIVVAIVVSIIIGTSLTKFEPCVLVQSTVKMSNGYESWSEALRTFATKLADDEFEGRNAGYPGSDKAAAYIADEFKKAKLIPMGDMQSDGTRSYFQRFDFESFYVGNNKLKSQNVVGMIEGTDQHLKHEIVVIGAHYDHVGRISQGVHLGRLGDAIGGDEIYNGADDNASGTAALMTIANAFREHQVTKLRLKRSVLFIAFGAEEAGLLGSRHYCNSPTAGQIDDHIFMINLDMVGRNPNSPVEIKGMGSAVGDKLRQIVGEAVKHLNLNAELADNDHVSGGDSDHSSFRNVGVPFIFFFTGFHDDYHKVTDHADKLAYDNMTTIAKTAMHILTSVANTNQRLIFKHR